MWSTVDIEKYTDAILEIYPKYIALHHISIKGLFRVQNKGQVYQFSEFQIFKSLMKYSSVLITLKTYNLYPIKKLKKDKTENENMCPLGE